MADDLWTLVEDAAQRWPTDPMLVSRQGDRCTFAEFEARVLRMAAGLQQLGVTAGDVVAWILPTWVDTVVLVAASSRLGAVQNPIIGIARDREVAFSVAQTAAQFLITPGDFGGYDFAVLGARVTSAHPMTTAVTVAPGAFPDGDPSTLTPVVTPGPRATRWVCYTSGTAADPKGACHADATVGAFSAAMAECMDVVHGDRYALVFPFPHIGGIGLLFMTLRTGCTHLLDAIVDPVATVEFLAEQHCTHAGTGTPFFNMYLAAELGMTAPLFPMLKACPAGGAPTAASVHRRVRAELGAPVVSSWGLTEAPVLTSGRLTDPADKLVGTEGRPLPDVDVRVVDGELRVRGPQVMLGYQDPTLDEDAFDADGYYRTGDAGTIDADGYVAITGRLKDVIIRNGENIAARSVEDLLHAMPEIAEAAVIGLPDDRTGEAVCAVVVLTVGTRELDRAQVQDALLAAGLRRQSLPTRLVVRSELPRNPAGKVLKRRLVDELRSGEE